MKALFIAIAFFAFPAFGAAQTTDIYKAVVLDVLLEGEYAVPATSLDAKYQALSVKILDGVREGQIVSVTNDSPYQLQEGEQFYLHHLFAEDGSDVWAVGEPDRSVPLLALTVIFVLATVIAGGMAGVRAIISLAGSFVIILVGLLPVLLSGAPPVLTCIGFAVLILVFSMFVTHGCNKPTFVALLGSFAALLLAALIAEAAVAAAHLSGFVSDEAVFLNFETGGTLDLEALLLGSILIGIVGVLNDISVSQVHTVGEITHANPALSRREVFARAMKVGREHLGAVVNTLPLAYAGAALPLLLLFADSGSSFAFIANRETFASEIIRILAGGIGLALSGAVATILAAYFLVTKRPPEAS